MLAQQNLKHTRHLDLSFFLPKNFAFRELIFLYTTWISTKSQQIFQILFASLYLKLQMHWDKIMIWTQKSWGKLRLFGLTHVYIKWFLLQFSLFSLPQAVANIRWVVFEVDFKKWEGWKVKFKMNLCCTFCSQLKKNP